MFTEQFLCLRAVWRIRHICVPFHRSGNPRNNPNTTPIYSRASQTCKITTMSLDPVASPEHSGNCSPISAGGGGGQIPRDAGVPVSPHLQQQLLETRRLSAHCLCLVELWHQQLRVRHGPGEETTASPATPTLRNLRRDLNSGFCSRALNRLSTPTFL